LSTSFGGHRDLTHSGACSERVLVTPGHVGICRCWRLMRRRYSGAKPQFSCNGIPRRRDSMPSWSISLAVAWCAPDLGQVGGACTQTISMKSSAGHIGVTSVPTTSSSVRTRLPTPRGCARLRALPDDLRIQVMVSGQSGRSFTSVPVIMNNRWSWPERGWRAVRRHGRLSPLTAFSSRLHWYASSPSSSRPQTSVPCSTSRGERVASMCRDVPRSLIAVPR